MESVLWRSLASFRARFFSTKPLQYITSAKGAPLAYRYSQGDVHKPGVIFCPGLFSNMEGKKAVALEAWCGENNYSFLRFDYSCIGESQGDIRQLEFTDWRDDVLSVIDNVAANKQQVIVGSSMGGWMMLHAALQRPDRVAGLVGICVAINIVDTHYDNVPEGGKKYEQDGEKFVTEYGEFIATSKFLESARELNLLRKSDDRINIHCPVRLIHGMLDSDVPYSTSLKIAAGLESNDIDIILRKAGDHRMSDDTHINLITQTLSSLLHHIQN